MADMRVYLVQHGHALSNQIDPQRPLSERGRQDIVNLAKFLQGKTDVSLVLHSGKTRAQQSAELLAKFLSRETSVEPFSALNPNDSLADLLSWLVIRQSETLIVGHLPYLSRLVAKLVCGSEQNDIVKFNPGSLVCLESSQAPSWRISWMIGAEQLIET